MKKSKKVLSVILFISLFVSSYMNSAVKGAVIKDNVIELGDLNVITANAVEYINSEMCKIPLNTVIELIDLIRTVEGIAPTGSDFGSTKAEFIIRQVNELTKDNPIYLTNEEVELLFKYCDISVTLDELTNAIEVTFGQLQP